MHGEWLNRGVQRGHGCIQQDRSVFFSDGTVAAGLRPQGGPDIG